MSGRYTKLFSLPENLYTEDCPVMICAGALSKDTQANKVFVQLRFQNIDSRFRNIVAVKVVIQALDVAENPLGGSKEYQYLDVKIQRGEDFGSKQPIFLEDHTSRSFSVSVSEVVFDGGEIWSGNTQTWRSLHQKKLGEKYSAELVGQYQRDTFAEAEYEPIAENGIWMCACGALNTTGDSRCCRCHNDKVTQFTALDHHTLTDNLQSYTAKKQEEEKKEVAEKRKATKKLTTIGCAVVLAICLLSAISSVIKNQQYSPIVKQLIGTQWETWDGYSLGWTFTDDETVQLRYISDDYEASWKVIDLGHKSDWYLRGKGNEYLQGEAMSICITFDYQIYSREETREIYVDVWLKDVAGETKIDFLTCRAPYTNSYDPAIKMHQR